HPLLDGLDHSDQPGRGLSLEFRSAPGLELLRSPAHARLVDRAWPAGIRRHRVGSSFGSAVVLDWNRRVAGLAGPTVLWRRGGGLDGLVAGAQSVRAGDWRLGIP